MTNSIDRTPYPRRYATRADELPVAGKETDSYAPDFDEKTNRIVLGIAKAGLLAVAGRFVWRRLHRGREQ
jgi:hypothetical protein